MSVGHCGNGCREVGEAPTRAAWRSRRWLGGKLAALNTLGLQTCRETDCYCGYFGRCRPWWMPQSVGIWRWERRHPDAGFFVRALVDAGAPVVRGALPSRTRRMWLWVHTRIARGIFWLLHWIWSHTMSPKYFFIKNLALPSDGTRVPVITPNDSSHIVIKNGDPVNPLAIETDSGSPDERQVIAGGQELEIRSFAPTAPWPTGAIVAYVSGLGGGPAIVRFTR